MPCRARRWAKPLPYDGGCKKNHPRLNTLVSCHCKKNVHIYMDNIKWINMQIVKTWWTFFRQRISLGWVWVDWERHFWITGKQCIIVGSTLAIVPQYNNSKKKPQSQFCLQLQTGSWAKKWTKKADAQCSQKSGVENLRMPDRSPSHRQWISCPPAWRFAESSPPHCSCRKSRHRAGAREVCSTLPKPHWVSDLKRQARLRISSNKHL